MLVSIALGSVELYPRFFHHRCFLCPLSPRRPEIRLGTVRFKVDIPHHPGFLLKLAANASRRLKLITGGVGEGGPPGGGVGNGWKRETRWLGWRRVMLHVYVKGEHSPLDIGGAVQFNLCYSCFEIWQLDNYSPIFPSFLVSLHDPSPEFYHLIWPSNRVG